MEPWILILLLHLAVSLPAPSSVSITSFNMEHSLHFRPGPGTPPESRFSVHTVNHRRSLWRQAAGCEQLTAGQMCNLTAVLKDPYGRYRARVRAAVSDLRSNWTESGWFQPLSDTVLGPPTVSVSGCGNCLILRLREAGTLRTPKPLHRAVSVHVRRTRDGAQFRLNLDYAEEMRITYLQPGVEYCVGVTVTTPFNSNAVASQPCCSFTSRPEATSTQYVFLGLLSTLCLTGFFTTGLVFYCLNHQRQQPARALVTRPYEGLEQNQLGAPLHDEVSAGDGGPCWWRSMDLVQVQWIFPPWTPTCPLFSKCVCGPKKKK